MERSHLCAGFNKTVKMISRGLAQRVLLAEDADEAIVSQIRARCRAAEIPVEGQYNKKTLGKLCGIEVGCAVAAELKESL